jgi:hypothetical protein
MLRQQRWVPDTCASPATGDACVLVEEWDDAADPAARTHAFVRAEKLCSHHAAVHGADHAACFAANYAENRRKNTTWLIALSVKAGLTLDQFAWSFSADRVLTASFGANLTNQQKATLQNAANVQFGPGKVVVT